MNWTGLWNKHFDDYSKSHARVGIFLNKFLVSKRIKIIEIACGSARDSIFLAKKGFNVIASDSNDQLIEMLKNKYKNINISFTSLDTFNLTQTSIKADIVFHNGLIGYFSDNKIKEILKQQVSITEEKLIIFVHNKKNKKLHAKFLSNKKHDELFNIRFFEMDELLKIINNSGIEYKDVKFLKFGGIIDLVNNKYIKHIPNILYPIRKVIVPSLYFLQPWSRVERICCVISLK